MLKWAVNVRRQTYLPGKDHLHLPSAQPAYSTQPPPSTATFKSSKTPRQAKEQSKTSSSLHSSCQNFSENPALRKLDSLRDLSNTGALPTAFNTPKRSSSHTGFVNLLKTPEASSPVRTNKPHNYASTLPTFDIEYSPSALMPCRSRVMKGKGLQDMYFKKPRYLGNNSVLFG